MNEKTLHNHFRLHEKMSEFEIYGRVRKSNNGAWEAMLHRRYIRYNDGRWMELGLVGDMWEVGDRVAKLLEKMRNGKLNS